MKLISQTILDWHARYGRKDLPWQNTQDAYRIWVSEIMLQQTQVSTVIPYYEKFMASFPTITSLANSNIDNVLHHWTGLGYYARARNLHKSAIFIKEQHKSTFPTNFDDVLALAGIGKSTAGAILAFSTEQRHTILDGNVKRVLARVYEVEGWYGKKIVEQELWRLAEKNTPNKEVARYTQAIMDFGATLCTRSKPNCEQCPVHSKCGAYAHNRTKELPHSKPKKEKPVKQTVMLLIQNDKGEILLQQRPPAGIWGGLWCPPETSLENTNVTIDGRKVVIAESRPMFRHTFSHYHLDITPALAKFSAQTDTIAESNERVWYNPNSPQPLGLAAPVKKLLDGLATSKSRS